MGTMNTLIQISTTEDFKPGSIIREKTVENEADTVAETNALFELVLAEQKIDLFARTMRTHTETNASSWSETRRFRSGAAAGFYLKQTQYSNDSTLAEFKRIDFDCMEVNNPPSRHELMNNPIFKDNFKIVKFKDWQRMRLSNNNVSDLPDEYFVQFNKFYVKYLPLGKPGTPTNGYQTYLFSKYKLDDTWKVCPAFLKYDTGKELDYIFISAFPLSSVSHYSNMVNGKNYFVSSKMPEGFKIFPTYTGQWFSKNGANFYSDANHGFSLFNSSAHSMLKALWLMVMVGSDIREVRSIWPKLMNEDIEQKMFNIHIDWTIPTIIGDQCMFNLQPYQSVPYHVRNHKFARYEFVNVNWYINHGHFNQQPLLGKKLTFPYYSSDFKQINNRKVLSHEGNHNLGRSIPQSFNPVEENGEYLMTNVFDVDGYAGQTLQRKPFNARFCSHILNASTVRTTTFYSIAFEKTDKITDEDINLYRYFYSAIPKTFDKPGWDSVELFSPFVIYQTGQHGGEIYNANKKVYKNYKRSVSLYHGDHLAIRLNIPDDAQFIDSFDE